MSAAGLATDVQGLDPCQVGEISAAWRVGLGALMLLGWQRDEPASEGVVSLQRAGDGQGRFNRLAWQPGTGGTEAFRFLAGVRLPPRAAVQGGDTLLLTAQRDRVGVLARLPSRFLDPGTFGAELAHAAPGAAASLAARFLTSVFGPPSIATDPAIRAMVTSFLDRSAEPDGCIEIAGAIRDRCVFLQGWGHPLEAGCDVLLAGTTIQRFPARTTYFARSDLAPPAMGQALVLPAEAAQADATETVFILGRDRIRRRPILAGHRALSEQDMVGHLRDVLPTLRCEASTRAALAAALQPRYEGRFTLHDAGHPVRLGADLAMAAPGAGTYLTGWLYDPAGVVASVHLSGTCGGAARLDATWTPIPRDDVTDAFRGDPALPPCEPGRHDHGFAVHAATLGGTPGENFYLAVSFRDGGCGFVPLTLGSAVDQASRDRLLASVDLHKSSGLAVIERHLAPFLARAVQDAPVPASAPLTPVPSTWSSAIVVPLSRAELPRALLSQFLRDPLARHEGLLLTCGDNWTELDTAALSKLARFYGVPAVIMRVGGTATPLTALDAAAKHTHADRFLLLGSGTVGRSHGWRSALDDAWREQGGTGCVSPTVLYEDDSIRFAGFEGLDVLDSEPYLWIRRRLAGLPAAFAGTAAAPTAGPSVACTLIPRAVLAAVKGRPSLGVTPSDHEIELLLRVRAAGASCLWSPTIQVHATEDPHGEPAMQERVGRLVSRWCLRAGLAKEK